MRLTKGTRLGPYEILEPLGQGGMGEVYRARDERLRRDIAVKVIHPELVTADSLGRFRREARVLAALSHPNVANVYELDEVDGTAFLVMEIVPGDTLATRLEGGPLPIPDVFRIAGQVAAALEAVHDKGIVHRDLKPSNIKVTRDGLVKVLDFGIAKPVVENTATRSHLPTSTVGATREGLVVGTAAYMSPEQVRGWEIDRRTDVWAFGCVLYEMLTGRPAFSGDSVADTIAAVIERDLDWGALPPTTPPGLTRLLRRCVQRDLKRRLRDMGDARLDLEEAASDSPTRDRPTPTLAARGWRSAAALMVGLVTLGVLLGSAAASYRGRSAHRYGAPVHFVEPLSPTTQLSGLDFPSVAISPDGSRLAFVGSRGGQTQLFVRQMNAVDSITALPGTTNAVAPFFNPDGSWVAFFADGQLKKVALSGGMPIPLCEAQVGLGGSWAGDTIVFASNTGSGLSTVPANAGRPQRVTNLDATKGEFSHRWPEWLPGGESVIYTVGTVGTWNQAEIVAQSLTTGERSVLVQGGTNPHYLPTGHLVYAHDGRIFAVPFDPRRLRVTGAPAPVLENVLQSTDGAAQFGVSQAGTAAYVSGEFAGRQGKLVSVTRDGAVMPFAGSSGLYSSPRVSADGGTLLVAVESPASDLWMYDIRSGSLSQRTYDAGATSPVWTPDGRAVFSSTKNGPLNLFISDVSRQGPLERLVASENVQIPGSWTSDGSLLAFVERRAGTGRDMFLLPRGNRVARPLLVSPADESAPRFSPNGRWLAYVSNESGQNEVYLRTAPGEERGQRVSSAGGMEPVWASDGSELFYREGDKMMVVALPRGTTRPAQPRLLFEGEFTRGTMDSPNYDIMPDGQRFVMVQRPRQESAQPTLHVLINWFATLSTP
jgi:serine/threonine protein kinase/Tol biopolymer transport system component